MAPALAQRPRTDRAFERLYRRHVADVYRYSLAVLRNPADAEDVTQTTFLNAYRAFARGERPDAAHNWLIKIAHNVCRQRFRTSARRPHEVAFDEDQAATIVEEQEGPTAQDIRRGLGQLAFNQRAALVARELEGRSYAEIGEILGLSVGAVETLIFRARRALREQLEGSLTCHEAEAAISRQLDGRLARAEKGALRGHLRQCGECATFARRLRAQRTALKALAAVPIPGSLASFFGGTSVGSGLVALKVGAAAATLLAAGAATSVGVKHAPWHAPAKQAVAAPAAVAPVRASLRMAAAVTPDAKPARAALAAPRAKANQVSKWSARSKSAIASRGSGGNGQRGKSAIRGRSAQAHARSSTHPSARGKKVHTSRSFAKKKDVEAKSRGGGGNGNGGNGNANGNGGGGDKLLQLPLPQPPVELPKLPKP